MRPKRSNKKVVCAPPLVTEAMHDLGVRQDAEKHLAQMEDKYHGLLEAAPDAMVVVNEDGEIVLLNLQAEKQFGYRRDELLGQKVTNIIPKGFAERLIADGKRTAAEALAQQIGTGIELIARRKDGSEFPIEIMLSPLESAEGILVTAAIRNISVRKNMERLKDEFVSVVSHELRTPLTSIFGSLSLLMAKPANNLPEPVARLIAIAHANSRRLVRLVNDILDIEKMDSGQVFFNFERVEVRSQVEQAIEANRGFAESHGVQIRLESADPIDVTYGPIPTGLPRSSPTCFRTQSSFLRRMVKWWWRSRMDPTLSVSRCAITAPVFQPNSNRTSLKDSRRPMPRMHGRRAAPASG